MIDQELKAGVAAILIYETLEQNGGAVSGPLIDCQVNNSILEKVLQICAHLDVDIVAKLIADSHADASE